MMLKSRFLRVWLFWSLFYLFLVTLGPNGLLPVPVWPAISQHVVQARAWLGDDIEVWNDNGTFDRDLEVCPRLDVTPYFRHSVINDPRESTLLANLAIAVRDPGGDLTPIQQAWSGSSDILLSEDLVCYVGFPPGPSFLLAPLVSILGGVLATQWLSAILGGLAVAVMDSFLADWLRTMHDGRQLLPGNLVAALAGAGTLWLWVVPDGGTFLFAQVVGTTALSLALFAAWKQHSWLAGLAYGIAITSRPAMLFALPLVLACTVLHTDAPGPTQAGGGNFGTSVSCWKRGATFLVGPLVLGALTMILNILRFGSFFEFGYRFMVVPAFLRQRLLEHGQVSLAHLGRNVHFVGLQPPMVVRNDIGELVFPYLASDPQGMGLLFVTPAFAAVLLALRITGRRRQGLLAATWGALILTCLPGLLYYNTGWVQWGGRFLIDAWPMWLLLSAVGLQRLPQKLAWILVALSMASNGWGAVLVATRSWPECCF